MQHWNNIPALGVGIVYMSGLADIIAAAADLVDFIEVEPQQHWFRETGPERRFRCDQAEFARIRGFGKPCLVHSVGCPIGGSMSLLHEHAAALQASIAALDPLWVSEHLSFNEFRDDGERHHAGFLLAPLAMRESVEIAARNLREFAACTGRPVAFETGVNYLRSMPGEWPDGAFVAAVAQAADCAILLDLHNAWTNARNGRQSVEDFVAMLPLERITELHLAGGEMLDGYWLDAHSGLAAPELLALARQIVPRLPNLKAITFEMMDQALGSGCDEQALITHLADIRELWTLRGSALSADPPAPIVDAGNWPEPGISARQWERCVGALANGVAMDDPVATTLSADPGITILRTLVEAVRAGTVIDALRLSSRLIVIAKGRAFLTGVLEDYWQCYTPAAFATDESLRFVHFLESLGLDIPGLEDTLALEAASCRAVADGMRQSICVSRDPAQILQAIAENRPPARTWANERWELEILPA